MMFEVRVTDAARMDLLAARSFYEQQNQTVGDYFYEAVLTELTALSFKAGIHPVIYKHHRALLRQFPYVIYYKVVQKLVYVMAIVDARQNPSAIEERFS